MTGRPATPAEIRAWDIDVRPDFTGLPKGRGSVHEGEALWERKCTSCHGTFAESNETFGPLAGGTTVQDIESGHAAVLRAGGARSTLAKVATLSTLWDYIHRAMPWNAPRSLTTDEVYALTAYLLSLGEIVPPDFVLSDENIRDVQKRLPNRHGMTTAHGLRLPDGKPDTADTACMSDCTATVTTTSTLPESARGAHGDLSRQQRPLGPVRGTRTGDNQGTAAGRAAAGATAGADCRRQDSTDRMEH